MTAKIKRLLTPLICAGVGLFNFIFMFMNYITFFTSGSDNYHEGINAYKAISFGDESLANILELMLAMFGKDAHLTFLLYIVAVLIIFMIIANVALLAFGVIGLVRMLAGINLVPVLDKDTTERFTKLTMFVNFIIHAASSFFVILLSLVNLYSGNIYGYRITLGVRPGIGLIFLLLFAVAAWLFPIKLIKLIPDKAPSKMMVYQCSFCGAQASASDKFCNVCGAAINAQEIEVVDEGSEMGDSEAQDMDYSGVKNGINNVFTSVKNFLEKKNITPKKLYIACASLLGVIVLIIVLVNIPWPQKPTYVVPENDRTYVYSESDDTTLIIENGEKVKDIDGKVYSSAVSLNGETMALLSEGSTLYVYYDGTLTEVDEDVKSFELSVEGTGIVYVNSDDELVLYSVDKASSDTVTDELYSTSESYYSISPNGKSVAYVEGSDDSDNYSLCVFNDGDSNEIDSDLIPLGLSDDAKLIYYYNTENDSVYVKSDKNGEAKLVNGLSDGYYYDNYSYAYKFNYDHTQLLFAYEHNWYVTEDGEEKHKISSDNIVQFADYTDFGLTMDDNNKVVTTPIRDFKKQYFLTSDDELYYLNKKLEAVEVDDSVDEFATTASGKVVYYLTYVGDLYVGEKYDDEFKLVAEDVDYFAITADGSKCYYVDEDDALMYSKKPGKSKKIADDIHSMSMTHDDYLLFIADYSSTNGGTLYYSRNGKDKERIADDVMYIDTMNASSYYYSNFDSDGAGDFYAATKKAKFERIATEVRR